jgi:XTP/dITP diphosphohydrolase
MKQLLIATWNPWKIQMFKNLLGELDLDLKFLIDLKLSYKSPEENWKSPQENALIKAKYFCETSGLPALWDDSGFEVEALNWEPWVMARRWWWELPDNISDEDWLNFYLEKVKNVPENLLKASFPFTRCLYLPNWKYFFQNDCIHFYLTKTPRRPFKSGWPTSAIRVFEDWRHEMDISLSDPIWQENLKKKWLVELLGNLE